VKEYDPRDTPGLLARVKAEAGTVLIVGHSNTVPEIVAGLGGARPADLAETDYGGIFRVRRDGTVERLRLETP
jgi:phosphohistidine phosphatase SixA